MHRRPRRRPPLERSRWLSAGRRPLRPRSARNVLFLMAAAERRTRTRIPSVPSLRRRALRNLHMPSAAKKFGASKCCKCTLKRTMLTRDSSTRILPEAALFSESATNQFFDFIDRSDHEFAEWYCSSAGIAETKRLTSAIRRGGHLSSRSFRTPTNVVVLVYIPGSLLPFSLCSFSRICWAAEFLAGRLALSCAGLQ